MTPGAEGSFRRVALRRIEAWSSFALDEVDVVAPDGTPFTRRFYHSPGVVAIVAIDDVAGEPSVVLVHQYRPAHDRWFWEIPAGTRDVDGEDPLSCAKRELLEEAGCEASEWSELLTMAPATGSADTVVQIWLARGLTRGEARPEGEEEREMVSEIVPLREAWRRLCADPPVNATTALALHLLAVRTPGGSAWLT